jgi:23S rRNA G2445 N2-methylase RlmL
LRVDKTPEIDKNYPDTLQGPDVPRQLRVLHDRQEVMREGSSKDLLTKATWRFYTHEFIGQRLTDVIAQSPQLKRARSVSVIDPFCGDGRLIGWLLEAVAMRHKTTPRTWNVELWDCDAHALDAARQQVRKTATRLGEQVEVQAFSGDTFARAPSRFGEFMVCVTNPPSRTLTG